MAKAKSVFFCKECGYESSKWLGQCPLCKSWDTFVEEVLTKKAGGSTSTAKASVVTGKVKPSKLSEISSDENERIQTGIEEFDRVLGGGIVIGSLVLVGGDPGIGKSTLLLQMCQHLVAKKNKVLYISGEESARQIKMRAERLSNYQGDLLLLGETNLEVIEDIILKEKPEVVIIDSIQTMYKEDVSSSPGSVSQVREATGVLMRLAKTSGISIFIVGHVTKEGNVAGPRVLEHMVDTVLYFEGDNQASYRMLRGVKNRFGSTNEVGVFEMRSEGLREVKNPSEFMLNGKPEGAFGSVVTCSIEGTRPIMVEVQALVSQTYYNMPRRTAAGTDYNRVNLLLAVIEKRLGVQLSSCDAYINVAGGMMIKEPALDLAIVTAMLSSYKSRVLDPYTMFFGEVGLTGEVRGVNQAEQRVMEAVKMGFKVCVLPAMNLANLENLPIKLIGIKSIKELLSLM